jgi:23S rRNA pseudouridine2605 synthase
MSNEDKPRGEGRGGAGHGRKPELRSRGYKDGPAGAKGGKGEGRSRGFKNRPQGLAPKEPAPGPEPRAAVEADAERIAKYLARAGVASRRDAERMIEAGRVSVDGVKLDTPAFTVTGQEKILVDGNPIPEIESARGFGSITSRPGW